MMNLKMKCSLWAGNTECVTLNVLKINENNIETNFLKLIVTLKDFDGSKCKKFWKLKTKKHLTTI